MLDSPADQQPSDIKGWNGLLRPYAAPDPRRSLTQLAITLLLFVGTVGAMLALDQRFGYWAALPVALPAGLLVVRLFIIQHDCGHHSYFRRRAACDWVGRVLGLVTLTPYGWWRREHDRHHATSGNLSRRGHGDIKTLTVREYNALSRWRRLYYRLYRHPIVLFGLGPAFQFMIRHRLPFALSPGDRQGRRSIMLNNLALLAVLVAGGHLLGLGRLLALWGPVMVVAGTVGVWLFFVQHQFAGTYWAPDERWSFVTAALAGSSYYRLPRPLEWLTAWIGYHHIHHLAPRVPNYRLPNAYQELAPLREARVIGIRESLSCARLALWCEERQRLLTFREAARAG